MKTLCHNCSHPVPDGAVFCPECAAPQLSVQPAEAPAVEEAEPPRHIGDIVWPTAVSSAAIYAIPTGIILSFIAVPIADMFWVIAGTVWALRHYRKRAPRAPTLTPELGGRIGMVVGLFAAVACAATDAVSYLVERFGLHHGAAIDAQLQSVAQAGFDRIHASNPDAITQLPDFFRFWASPEGHGSLLLCSAAAATGFMLFSGWLGGRFTVRFTVRRRRGA